MKIFEERKHICKKYEKMSNILFHLDTQRLTEIINKSKRKMAEEEEKERRVKERKNMQRLFLYHVLEQTSKNIKVHSCTAFGYFEVLPE